MTADEPMTPADLAALYLSGALPPDERALMESRGETVFNALARNE